MTKPSVVDAKAVARLCRFLKGLPRLAQRIPFADYVPSLIEVYVDNAWVGCRRSRKATSGGVVLLGGAAVRGWSSNQGVIALSSGEAEYHAALNGASCALKYCETSGSRRTKSSIQTARLQEGLFIELAWVNFVTSKRRTYGYKRRSRRKDCKKEMHWERITQHIYL